MTNKRAEILGDYLDRGLTITAIAETRVRSPEMIKRLIREFTRMGRSPRPKQTEVLSPR